MIPRSLSYSHSSDDNQKSLESNVYFVWQIILLWTPVYILIVPQAGWTQFTMQIRLSCGKTNFKEEKKIGGHKASWIFFFPPEETLRFLEGCRMGSPRNENPFCTQQTLCTDDTARTSFLHSQVPLHVSKQYCSKEGWITLELFYC